MKLAALITEGQVYCCTDCPFCACLDGALPAAMLLGSGWLYCSTKQLTVGLTVRNGRITQAPPIARKWALGRPAPAVAMEARRRGAQVSWHPEPAGQVVPD